MDKLQNNQTVTSDRFVCRDLSITKEGAKKDIWVFSTYPSDVGMLDDDEIDKLIQWLTERRDGNE